MRIIVIALVSLVLTMPVAAAFGAETLTCNYKEKFKDGGVAGCSGHSHSGGRRGHCDFLPQRDCLGKGRRRVHLRLRCVRFRWQVDVDAEGATDIRRAERRQDIDLRNPQGEKRIYHPVPGDVAGALRLRGGVPGIHRPRQGQEEVPREVLRKRGASKHGTYNRRRAGG